MISCLLHSLQFATNIFQLIWNLQKISYYRTLWTTKTGWELLANLLDWKCVADAISISQRRKLRSDSAASPLWCLDTELLESVMVRWRHNVYSMQFVSGADPACQFMGAISVIFGSQVSVSSQVSFWIAQNHGEKCYFRKF